MKDSTCRPSNQILLIALIGFALIRGIIYLAVIPPWQHYDEPAHFRRLDRVTELVFFPNDGDHSLSLRQELVASQCDFSFWEKDPCPALPDLMETSPTLRALGADYQPIYYYLIAPLQALLAHTSLETRLYAGRFISVIFYGLTILIAYGTACEMFPKARMLQWAIPVFMATLPAYTENMSALNSDAGGVLLFSLMVWGAVRLIRRGISPFRLVWVIGVALLGALTKRTALIGPFLALLAILLSFRPWHWRTLLIGVGVVMTIGSLLFFDMSGYAHWYQVGDGHQVAPRLAGDAVLGDYSLQATLNQESEAILIQQLPRGVQSELQDKTVTFGGWIRTDVPMTTTVKALSLYDGHEFHSYPVELTNRWRFHAFTAKVNSKATTLQVRLSSEVSEGTASIGKIYYDGIVLVRGFFPVTEVPAFSSALAEQGRWGGRPYDNILHNASGEQRWPALRPWVSTLAAHLTVPIPNPTLFFQSMLDWRRTGWVYKPIVRSLSQSFWARFGWNHVGLEDGDYEWIYWALSGLTTLGLIGSFRSLLASVESRQLSPPWQKRSMMFLWIMVLLTFLVALLGYSHPQVYGIGSPIVPHIPISSRYLYPAVIPITILLCIGWQTWLPLRWRRYLPMSILWLGVALDLISLVGVIIPYYYI
jgi:hypothetical protein